MMMYAGHEEIKKFLKGKWEKELDYKLKKNLFTFNVWKYLSSIMLFEILSCDINREIE